MALPELFRHRDLFIGCLAISRTPRRRSGERLRVVRAQHVLDDADAAAFDVLGDTLLHASNAPQGGYFNVVTQGYDYPSLARCPALQDDGLCGIHANGKPAMCEVVPLDPMVPDSLQYLALEGRSAGAAYIDAACIQAGGSAGAAMLVGDGLIHDPAAREAIARRRQMLAMEREIWGRAVFASLRKDLFDAPDAVARIPADGFLTISIAPVLLAVADVSEQCRQMSVTYVDSQLALIERKIAQALARRRLDDRPVTRELRTFSDAYQRTRAILTAMPRGASTADTRRVEAYLSA